MKQCARVVGAVACCLVWMGCVSAPDIALTQTLELPGTGHVMDYPAGWYVEVMEPLGAAVVSQNQAELAMGIVGDQNLPRHLVARGPEVWIQRAAWVTAARWADYAGSDRRRTTTRDLVCLAELWGWQEPAASAVQDVQVAGVTAAVAELPPPPSAAMFYVAMVGDQKDVYLVRVMAPTTKDLERFRPTWEKMLASIRPAQSK